ncbi:MAG: hypothetical protein LBT64_01995 [Puniceicoccales bacterium]|jgi:hypothetical protein|nr:hypothetical protein [Puniceicoccales bacterium]
METANNNIHYLNLQSATWREFNTQGYFTALDLEIDGKHMHLFELNRSHIRDGFIPVPVHSKTDWKSILPEVVLDERIAKKHGFRTNRLKGVINDPRIVKLAGEFWEAVNSGGFVADKKVYPAE